MAGVPSRQRFSLDPDSVAGYREQLRAMAAGIPFAEAAIEGFSDWQVLRAIERLWDLGSNGRTAAPGAGALARNPQAFSRPALQGDR
jgi:hypothetical protein